MALSDYKQVSRVFELKGASFEVKALSLNEMRVLIRQHMPDLEALFQVSVEALEGKSEVSESDIQRLVVAAVEQAPGLVANVIALSAGETDEAGVAAAYRLPFPVQVDVLLAIGNLTFDEVGGVKKWWGAIAGLLGKTKIGKAMTGVSKAP